MHTISKYAFAILFLPILYLLLLTTSVRGATTNTPPNQTTGIITNLLVSAITDTNLASNYVTKRTASVVIHNMTGQTIHSLMMIHKYSDVYSNLYSQGVYIAASDTEHITNEVEYNTGFGTTGQDWWMLSWVTWDGTDTNGAKKYITNPNNFRFALDLGERTVLQENENTIVSNIVNDLRGSTEIIQLATDLYKPIVARVLNTESTTGFKKHVLRAGDTNIDIWIYPEGVSLPPDEKGTNWAWVGNWFEETFNYGIPRKNLVVIHSPSGYSTTVYTQK